MPHTATVSQPVYKAPTAYQQTEAVQYDAKRFTLPCGKRIHRFELEQLLWALSRVPAGGRVLELGCGTGRLLTELLQRGHRVEGADASSAMLDQLDKKLAARGLSTPTRTVQAAKTGFDSDSFDFTYAIRLLNQTESPDYALRVVAEMVRITRPGGYVLAEFVNDYRPRWGAAAHPHRSQTTRLRPRQVAEAGKLAGAELMSFRGCFLLGMQAYHLSPPVMLPTVATTDRLLSRALPRLCARTYAFFRKEG